MFSADELRQMEEKRMLIRGEQLVDTEINIQLGSLTLNTSRLEVLDGAVIAMHDFKVLCPRSASVDHKTLFCCEFVECNLSLLRLCTY